MKSIKFLRHGLFIFLLIACQFFGSAQETQTEKPQIALLGTFHFAGTSDMAGIVMENVKGERRQQEIKELVTYLKAFNPTKILLEYPEQMNDTLNLRYRGYLENNFELPANETYQVGFRLAKELGHSKVFAIDYRMDLPFDELMKYCEETDNMHQMQAIIDLAQNYTQQATKTLKDQHLVDFLADMNQDKMDRFGNGFYLNQTLAIGDPENEIGAQVAATWYQRNLIMFKNLTETITSSQDRVLVIVGASHRAMIKDMVNNRDDLRFVEISNYLKR